MTVDLGGVRRWLGRLPRSAPTAVVSAPALAAVAGLFLGTPGDRTLRAFLGTLATVQSGVLAIVFSVALVAIQLTTRYSSRIAPLYARSPTFQFTFSVFAVSVGLDLVLLFNTPLNGTPAFRAGVYAAGGLAVGAAVTLYGFVRRLTDAATPEGVVRLFEQDLDTETYLDRVRAFERDESETHPLRSLYTMAMTAVSEHEVAAAETALSKERELAISHHQALQERGRLSDLDNSVEHELVKPVVYDHLRDLVVHADEQDEYGLMRQAVEAQVEIGSYGLETGDDKIAEYGIRVLGRQARSVDSDGQTNVQTVLWDGAADLLSEAVDHGRLAPTRTAAKQFRTALLSVVPRQPSDTEFHFILREAIDNIQRSLEDLLKQNGDTVGSAERDWIRELPDGCQDPTAMAWHLLRAYRRVTSTAVTTQTNDGEDLVDSNWIVGRWCDLCTAAAEEAGGEFTTATCRLLIELALITGDGEYDLERVRAEAPDHVEAAFDEILQYDPMSPDSSESMPWLFERDGDYYQNGFNTQGPPLNVRDDYPESVETLRERVTDQSRHDGESPDD